MNLRTIWALHMAMPLPERLRRTREWAAQKIAAHFIPKRIKYWVTVQQMAKVSTKAPFQHWNPMSLTVQEIMEHMDRPKKVV